jgi:hypothetical protein
MGGGVFVGMILFLNVMLLFALDSRAAPDADLSCVVNDNDAITQKMWIQPTNK